MLVYLLILALFSIFKRPNLQNYEKKRHAVYYAVDLTFTSMHTGIYALNFAAP